MPLKVALHHKTEYTFDRPTGLSPHVVRLRPAPHCRTKVQAYSLRVQPEEQFLNWQQDPFGNFLARLVFPTKTRRLTLEVDVVAEMTVINPFDFFVEDSAQTFPFSYDPRTRVELAPYLTPTEHGELLNEWLTRAPTHPRRTIDFLVEINRAVQQDVRYLIRMEPGVQSCEETLARRSGSCRDSAWLLVQVLRRLGLAARFVSGYIIQLTADQKPIEGPAGPERDFSDLHAWTEVYVPGAGWIGLDPTSGLLAGEGHLPLACAPDPTGAAPVTGFTDPCESALNVAISVQRLREEPRVTRPYRDEEWSAIQAIGDTIEQKLTQGDVRLTMGGEPTFVSIDDRDGPEWNTEALGVGKKERALDLLRRLHRRFAPGGLLHHGQGKWYPGEPLPRWSLSCFWRKDGDPIWRREDLDATYAEPSNYGLAEARGLIWSIARQLGVAPKWISAGYEDVYYYLWKEGTLPSNVDPLKADLREGGERERLRKLLERGLDRVTGYVLPIRRNSLLDSGRWESGPWPFRRERLYLIPGDSPMGYRLPLDSLPFVAPGDRPIEEARSPLEPRRPLPRAGLNGHAGQKGASDPASGAGPVSETSFPEGQCRTALCVEPRDGVIHVFMPPLPTLEAYLELVRVIEIAAGELALPVAFEGYRPPNDSRLAHFSVTPDPGVIEVNIHPAGNWNELNEITTALYEEARLARLTPEKFLIDGRHTGTGGGNHVTLGGPTPNDSPLLRRPDLLRRMVTYWQHHPSLSYLFSGLFLGPTSQAPRVDEARHDALYELEIAFQQSEVGRPIAPWTVDRLYRDLLVDVTGNTHRAEFCIDKLHSPESFAGRLGLLELRNLEMPPHERMSLVQMLLLRGLVARFWNEPYDRPLVRWGTSLHDRFMLPHYVWEDFRDVIDGLKRAGLPFEAGWFLPFFEFRFPKYGAIQVGDIQVELRMALEPWHVLGEAGGQGGTARYVDSSLERLQVRVSGMTDSRHVVTCNGRRLPLHSTGRQGESVSGVRFRAWQPPSALHPMIPVHSPLVFDLVDLWNGRSVGGCTYHVSHPGGRFFDTLPVNAFEAESRRIARFEAFGHTPGPLDPEVEVIDKEYPNTLDLRKLACV